MACLLERSIGGEMLTDDVRELDAVCCGDASLFHFRNMFFGDCCSDLLDIGWWPYYLESYLKTRQSILYCLRSYRSGARTECSGKTTAMLGCELPASLCATVLDRLVSQRSTQLLYSASTFQPDNMDWLEATRSWSASACPPLRKSSTFAATGRSHLEYFTSTTTQRI
jgi:hypothetical protein